MRNLLNWVEGKHSFLLSVLFIIGIIINLYLIGSMLIGIILLLLYFLTVGKKIGDIFLEDPVPLKFLIGIFLFLGWLIISEGAILYFGMLKMPWILIPALTPPFILQTLKRRKKQIKADFPISVKQNAQILTKKNILLFAGFAILWVLSFFILLASRTGSMIFSVWEVLPFYFVILLAGLVMLCVLVSHSLVQNKNGHKISLLLVFLIAFLIFFIPVIVYEYSFDSDIWTSLAFLKTIANTGRTYPPEMQTVEAHKVGFLALITTLSNLVTLNPSFDFWRGITWLISPILGTIFIPFFTYCILLQIYPSNEKNVLAVSSLAFTLFPSFWYVGISINTSIAQIFLFPTIFFGVRLFRNKGRTKILIPLILSALATLFIEVILGFYALAFMLFAFVLWTKWGSHKILMFISIFIVIASMPLTLVYIKTYLGHFLPLSLQNSEYTFYFSLTNSYEKAANFLYPPLYNDPNWVANSINGHYFNWVRYVILLVSVYIFKKRNFNRISRLYGVNDVILITSISFFFSWFSVWTFVEPKFLLGSRFAYPVDVLFTPLAGVVLYSTYGKICDNITKIGNKSRIRRISNLFLLVLIVLGSLTPISFGFLSPSFTKDRLAPDPGRPTWRAISGEEIAVINFIKTSYVGENHYVVLSDYFLGKVAAGNLGIRYSPTPNFNTGFELNPYFDQMLSEPSQEIMHEVMKKTNSSVAYFILSDFWINHFNISRKNINLMKSLATEYKVFGSEYKIYVFKYEMSTK